MSLDEDEAAEDSVDATEEADAVAIPVMAESEVVTTAEAAAVPTVSDAVTALVKPATEEDTDTVTVELSAGRVEFVVGTVELATGTVELPVDTVPFIAQGGYEWVDPDVVTLAPADEVADTDDSTILPDALVVMPVTTGSLGSDTTALGENEANSVIDAVIAAGDAEVVGAVIAAGEAEVVERGAAVG